MSALLHSASMARHLLLTCNNEPRSTVRIGVRAGWRYDASPALAPYV